MATTTMDTRNHPRRFSNQAVVWTIIGIVLLALIIAFAARNDRSSVTTGANTHDSAVSTDTSRNSVPAVTDNHANMNAPAETSSGAYNSETVDKTEEPGAARSASGAGTYDQNAVHRSTTQSGTRPTTNPSPGPVTKGMGPNSAKPAHR